jgi:hypothetical protein
MTKAECDAMVRRVYADPKANPEETQLVIDVVLEGQLFDYDAAVELLHRIERELLEEPTRH